MPTLSRVAIRTALAWLIVSLIGWVLLALGAEVGLSAAWYPAVWHVLAVGWLTQLIVAVAYWFFPKHKGDVPARGNVPLAWASFALLNVGLVLRVAAEPARGTGAGWVRALLVVSAVTQLLGVLGWCVLLWPRVRGKKRRGS